MKRAAISGGCWTCLLSVVLAQGPIPVDQPADTSKDDLRILQQVGLSSEGPSLLEYFRKRTFKEANPQEMNALIQQLGSDDFVLREKAFSSLVMLGPSAVVGLKDAEASKDTEVKQRARDLRERLEAKAEPPIQAATARLIGRSKPAGAAEVLLAYLPFAADLAVTDEICKALGEIAVRDKTTDPAVTKVLVAALSDKLPIKRGAAAEALIRAKATDQVPEVRKLLKDADPGVRLRSGLALLANKEKEALPVLIELLNHLSPEQLWPVEEILIRLAGEEATPTVSLGTTDDSRKAAFKAWNEWHTQQAAKVDLAKLDQIAPTLGHTVIVQQKVRVVVGGRVAGEILELDKNKKVLWRFDVTSYPVDAQVFEEKGELRVLIAEFQANQVTIRDTKGTLIKDFRVGGNPIGAQRLANGNVFVVMQNRLVEYDAKGNEVYAHNRPNHDVFRAKKLANGEIALITNAGAYQRIEGGKGQAVRKTFQVAPIPVLFGSMDVLPNGNVIVPDFQQNRVVEYNADGKQIAQFNVQWPNSALRLPNGNTLVASQNTRKVTEFNRGGQVVWEFASPDGMIFNARRR